MKKIKSKPFGQIRQTFRRRDGRIQHWFPIKSVTLKFEKNNEACQKDLSFIWAPLRVHVTQADGRLLLLDVQALRLFAGDQISGYSSRY